MVELGDVAANPGIKLGGLLAATLVLSYAANYWLSRIFVGKTYRYLVAPGIIIHEYSHAAGCLLTGTPIKSVSVFEPTGGHVVHAEPRLPLVQGVISTAPVFGAALSVYLLARWLVPGLVDNGELMISAWQIFLFAYLAASITAVMAPSTADLRSGLLSFGLVCAAIGFGSLSSRLNDYFAILFGDSFDGFVSVILFALAVLTALTAAAGAAYLVLHRTTREGVRYQSD